MPVLAAQAIDQHLSFTNLNLPQQVEMDEEAKQFIRLQNGFAGQYEHVFPDKLAAKTVIIIPSLTLDTEILSKIKGVNYYEERMLCMLMLLRMPNTRVIYVTSMPIHPVIIDYYLHLLPGITSYHAKERLTLLSCHDASRRSLTEKILERPRLIDRIRESVPHGHLAHIAFFNVTNAERKLAVKLQAPVYGCNPDLQFLGNKSNSRRLFREAGLDMPAGYENLYTEDEIVECLYKLKLKEPSLRKAVVKINEGFSGEGNAVFSYQGAPRSAHLKNWIRDQLPYKLEIVADHVNYNDFMNKFLHLGGVVEAFLEGAVKTSPSVQCRINPLGKIEIISTHDQLTGGENGQVFLGANFPASAEYASSIASLGRKVSAELKRWGVLGRFSVDFISVKEKGKWRHYAIEINLRKGGTTHPYLMLQFLTDGRYDEATGIYYTANNQPRFYVASDNLQSNKYVGLTPQDFMDIAICNQLQYDGSTQEGVMFHLLSTLSQYGKLGLVCIGATAERAQQFYDRTKEVLDREGRVNQLRR